MKEALVIILVLVILVVGCAKPEPIEDEVAEQTMREIAQSHIEGNAPAEEARNEAPT